MQRSWAVAVFLQRRDVAQNASATTMVMCAILRAIAIAPPLASEKTNAGGASLSVHDPAFLLVSPSPCLKAVLGGDTSMMVLTTTAFAKSVY